MSNSLKTEENDLLVSLENDKIQLKRTSFSNIATFFETFIPEQAIIDDSLLFNQPQNFYVQAQFPQTNSAASGSNIPLTIFIAHANSDDRPLQDIKQILRTIQYQCQEINIKIGLQFGEIDLDQRWKTSRYNHLESADLILLLVTQAFVATEYCYSDQLKLAIWRHTEEKAYIIPILMEACSWERTRLNELYTITPKDTKGVRAVNEWHKSKKLALNVIEDDIYQAVCDLHKGR